MVKFTVLVVADEGCQVLLSSRGSDAVEMLTCPVYVAQDLAGCSPAVFSSTR